MQNPILQELEGQLADFDVAINAQKELIAVDGELFPHKLSLEHLQAERDLIITEIQKIKGE